MTGNLIPFLCFVFTRDNNDIEKLKNELINNKEKDNSQGNNIDQNNNGFIVRENSFKSDFLPLLSSISQSQQNSLTWRKNMDSRY